MLLSILALLLMDCSEHNVGGHTVDQVFMDPDVRTLAKAACEGNEAQVRDLVARGVSVNAQGDRNVTPLWWALTCRSERGMGALLDAGADPGLGPDDYPPVLMAATYDDPTFLKLLLAGGGDPDATDAAGRDSALYTALSVGIDRDDWRNYYVLLDAGADINREYMGRTVAEQASALGQMGKAVELLERGYTHDLERLALGTYVRHIGDTFPEISKQKQQLLELLKVKGVPVDEIIAKYEARNAQFAREQEALEAARLRPTPPTSQ